MKELSFRTLRASEIEVRPQQIKDGKASMLLYMDSRVVVNLLNETVGALNWQSDFKEVNGQLIGSISIWDEEKSMWITKSDTGSESNIEAQKGLVSDCYKRCLSRWGVDELYSAPKIVIPDDGYKCTGYKVSEIDYDSERDITHLVVVNRFGKEAFRWDKDQKATPRTKTTEEVIDEMKSYCRARYKEYKDGDRPMDACRVEEFVNHYSKILSQGLWKYGEFNTEKQLNKWMTNNR